MIGLGYQHLLHTHQLKTLYQDILNLTHHAKNFWLLDRDRLGTNHNNYN
jgi:hypothetical protein